MVPYCGIYLLQIYLIIIFPSYFLGIYSIFKHAQTAFWDTPTPIFVRTPQAVPGGSGSRTGNNKPPKRDAQTVTKSSIAHLDGWDLPTMMTLDERDPTGHVFSQMGLMFWGLPLVKTPQLMPMVICIEESHFRGSRFSIFLWRYSIPKKERNNTGLIYHY